MTCQAMVERRSRGVFGVGGGHELHVAHIAPRRRRAAEVMTAVVDRLPD